MGCDLHSHVEVRSNYGWHEHARTDWGDYQGGPFENRNYGVYGWLAGVRNYSEVGPIVQPRGIPYDVSETVKEAYGDWELDAHTPSFLLVSELLAVDYDAEVNDRRVTRQTGPNSFDGGCTGSPEEGTAKPLREFLGGAFMRDLDKLRSITDPAIVRVVFWFDN